MANVGLLTERAREYGSVEVDRVELDVSSHTWAGLEGHARTYIASTPFQEELPSTDVVTHKSLKFSVHEDGVETPVFVPVVEL